jgi:hypothetical protein
MEQDADTRGADGGRRVPVLEAALIALVLLAAMAVAAMALWDQLG